MTAQSIEQPDSDSDAWGQIERLLDQIATLAQSDISVAGFYQHLLDGCVQATAAVGGAVWLRNANGAYFLEYQIQLESTRLMASSTAQQQHGRLLESIDREREPRAVQPLSGQIGGDGPENPSEVLLIVCPLRMGEQSIGAIELFQRPLLHPAAQRGNLRLLKLVSESAVDFHRHGLLRDLRQRALLARDVDAFAQRVHGDLDLRATAYSIVNEGRPLLRGDRVELIRIDGRRAEVLAISGLDQFDRRSPSIRLLERLAVLVSASEEMLWYTGDTTDLAPQVEQALRAYVDETHVRSLVLLPLPTPVGLERTGRGLLVVEKFDGQLADDLSDRLQAVRRHAATAFHNASQFNSIPLRAAIQWVMGLGWLIRLRQLPKTILVVFGVLLISAVLALVPTEFTIKVRGQLQPLERRNVFAPVDAVVREVLVQHDAAVSLGTVLAVLESEQLALQQQQVQGERDQTQQRLLAIVAEKLKGTRDERDPNLLSRLTSQETELRQMLAAQDQQLNILRQQIESLVVRSPLDGRVLSWSTEELLVRRPVRRGQILMTVANVDGPWILELQVPDWEIAHVQAGRIETSSGQRVTFMLGTQPGVEYRGWVRQVAATITDSSDATDQMPSVLVTADIDGQAISNLRPGASVSARIDCGRRSIGYVWLRQLWEAIEARVLF